MSEEPSDEGEPYIRVTKMYGMIEFRGPAFAGWVTTLNFDDARKLAQTILRMIELPDEFVIEGVGKERKG